MELLAIIASLLLLKQSSLTTIPQQIEKKAEKAHQYALNHHLVSSPIMVIVDYSKPSKEKRLWLFNTATKTVIANDYVAHGSGSGFNNSTKFSNRLHSRMSSLGFFLTQQQYFGQHGKSIRLKGLESNINNNAATRGIVIHQAPYVSKEIAKNNQRLGRSWGCFAVSQKTLSTILAHSKKPILLMSYYPKQKWLSNSVFLK